MSYLTVQVGKIGPAGSEFRYSGIEYYWLCIELIKILCIPFTQLFFVCIILNILKRVFR